MIAILYWKKGYEATSSAHDISDKILSSESNYTVDVVIWPKFGNSIISMRKIIITNFIRCWTEKQIFFKGGLG